MTHPIRRAVAVAAAALVPAAVAAPAAYADVATFPDSGGQITSVRVSHGPRTIGVTAYDKEMTLTTVYRFWLDTDPDDPGPDYKVEVYPDSDGMALEKVTTFSSPGTEVACAGLDAIADTEGEEYAKIIVPRSCVGTPGKVRVAVVGYYTDPTVVDWAPGVKRFYPWVNR